MARSSSADPLKSAQATLIALRAICGDMAHLAGYIVPPETAVLSFADAALALARLGAPVWCLARLVDRHLVIDYRPCRTRAAAYGGDDPFHPEYVLAVITRLFGSRVADPAILVRGRDESVVMRATEIADWLRDYDFTACGFGYSLDDPDDTERAAGCDGTMIIAGPIQPTAYHAG